LWLGGVVYWLRGLRVLAVKLLLSFDGDGALICPVAFVFAVEVAEWDLLSSAAVTSSTMVILLIAAVPVFAIMPVIPVLPITSSSVVLMVGVPGLLFGYSVDCFMRLHLICMPRLRVCFVTVSALLLVIHFLDPSPLAPV
jgi:hypothetical protein